jgi:O-antigen ligase
MAKEVAGGYHSEYLTALAEQGVVGFVAVLCLFWFLIRSCWNLAFRFSHTWQNGQWALFGCFFLLVRAGVEVPGLFGYAQEPADYLAYVFLAIAVSSISREEDYVRSAIRKPVRSVTPFLFRSRPAAPIRPMRSQ